MLSLCDREEWACSSASSDVLSSLWERVLEPGSSFLTGSLRKDECCPFHDALLRCFSLGFMLKMRGMAFSWFVQCFPSRFAFFLTLVFAVRCSSSHFSQLATGSVLTFMQDSLHAARDISAFHSSAEKSAGARGSSPGCLTRRDTSTPFAGAGAGGLLGKGGSRQPCPRREALLGTP